MSTWLTSWWGWSNGSVSDRALELELRGKAWFFFELPFGYLNDADLSNDVAPPPFCSCCWKRIAAASARSCIKFSSFLDDRILVHRLLPKPPSPAAALFVIRLEPLLFGGGDLSSREKQEPIVINEIDCWYYSIIACKYMCTYRKIYAYESVGYSYRGEGMGLALYCECGWLRKLLTLHRKWKGASEGSRSKNAGVTLRLFAIWPL